MNAMQEIKLNTKGRIVQGLHVGRYIEVIDDTDNTGGFYVFQSTTETFDECFDDWMQTWELVEQHFMYWEWEIEWLESAE